MAQETNISPAEIVAQLKDSQPIKSSLSADSQVPGQWQREQEAINQPDRLGVRGKAFSASMTREAYGKDQSVCRADLLLWMRAEKVIPFQLPKVETDSKLPEKRLMLFLLPLLHKKIIL